MTPDAQVVKVQGDRPWHVVREGTMLRRVQTRREADLICRLFNGDLSAATPWYRLEYSKLAKLTRNPAMAAASSAYHLGVPASAVWADPATGEPFQGPLPCATLTGCTPAY